MNLNHTLNKAYFSKKYYAGSFLGAGEDYADGMIRVYSHPICEIIDDYNSSAYYEPSYVLTRSYWSGSFN